jgi:hypothetical protein
MRGGPDWSSGDEQGTCWVNDKVVQVGAREPEEVWECTGPIGWGHISGRSVGWLVRLDRWFQVMDY